MTATCNGDGDGDIAMHESLTDSLEAYLFWQHLSLAGLIEGSYSGSRGPDNEWHHVPGVNSPRSKYSSAAWSAEASPTDGHTSEKFARTYGNSFFFGSADSYEMTYEPVLTPEEAWNIDTKVDDGKPARGSVIAMNFNGCTDAANRSDFDSDYELSVSDVECTLYFEDRM